MQTENSVTVMCLALRRSAINTIWILSGDNMDAYIMNICTLPARLQLMTFLHVCI